jgi:hypothetical protein
MVVLTMIGLDGTLGKEVLLDGRVCECCATSAASTPDGIAVVYRDRSKEEVRDISIVRLRILARRLSFILDRMVKN